MIPFAEPLATEEICKEILQLTKAEYAAKALVSGIKACRKSIVAGNTGILVLSKDTSPTDLISHFPVLCEERDVPYIFVETRSWINGFTCVFLKCTSEPGYKKVIDAIQNTGTI